MSYVIKRFTYDGIGNKYELKPDVVSSGIPQCRSCAFNLKSADDCPRNNNEELSCNEDLTSAWVKVDAPMLDKPQGAKAEVQIGHIDGSAAYANPTSSDYFIKTQPNAITGIKDDKAKMDWAYLTDNFIPELEGMIDVLSYGNDKYPAPDRSNWKRVPYLKRRYCNAALRHLLAYTQGEVNDNESSFSHLHHAMTNLLFLSYFEREDKKEKSNDTK